MGKIDHSLQSLLDKASDGKNVVGCVFSTKKGDYEWTGSAGNMTPDQSFFVASTTKLFTSAIILYLQGKRKLFIDDKISPFMPAEMMSGLHVLDGTDFSEHLSIRHLMSHASGLPDYFSEKDASGHTIEKMLRAGNDISWTPEEAVAKSKEMTPHFYPRAKGKAFYSDTNYQILGMIIEEITGQSYAECVRQFITEPLGMTQTYVYADPTDTTPAPIHSKSGPIHIPNTMVSAWSDGGIVSTAQDLMKFTTAFFDGELFPSLLLSQLTRWKKIFFPLKSGVGLELFEVPRVMNPFGKKISFMGYCGISGCVAFHEKASGITITGTTNQIVKPQYSFMLMTKMALKINQLVQ